MCVKSLNLSFLSNYLSQMGSRMTEVITLYYVSALYLVIIVYLFLAFLGDQIVANKDIIFRGGSLIRQ